MIVLGRNREGASLETLTQMVRTIAHTFPVECPVRWQADELLRNINYKRQSVTSYLEDDAIAIIVARASNRLLEAQKEVLPNLEVISFLRAFIEATTGRVLPDVSMIDICHTIRDFFAEDPQPTGLEGFCYGTVITSMYGDMRVTIQLCGIDDLRQMILAHIDIVTTRPDMPARYKDEMVHAYGRVLGVFH